MFMYLTLFENKENNFQKVVLEITENFWKDVE